ncbi:MAG TPA: glycosyltransferase [Pirellulales bacterium]|nr:glycosyltransferase [Pirellulales bacterium]
MPNSDSRVAVAILTHNRCPEVLRSLERLTSLPEKPAIVLVDNASSDGTVEAVSARYPEVEVIRSTTNLGAAGRNLALLRLNAPYVALSDDDTWWQPGSLARARELFDAHPRLAVATARVLVGPEEELDPTCLVMEASPLAAEPGLPGRPLLGFLAGASVVRREAFLEAGGFNERLFLGGEEQWVAAELASRGWWLCYVPEMVVHHHPSPHREASRRRWHEVRNALWFAWLRRPPSSALACTLWLARTRRFSDMWRGLLAALSGLPRIWNMRRIVPENVEEGFRRLDAMEREHRCGASAERRRKIAGVSP